MSSASNLFRNSYLCSKVKFIIEPPEQTLIEINGRSLIDTVSCFASRAAG